MKLQSICVLLVAAEASCQGETCGSAAGEDTTAMLQFAVPSGSAVQPDQAVERAGKRHLMKVEQNLRHVFHQHAPQTISHLKVSRKHGPESCLEHAQNIFDAVIVQSSLDEELQAKELATFRQRFASALKSKCKEMTSETMWREIGAEEFEMQKPLMTAALAASINQAGLGFKAKMHDWLLHESVGSLPGRLGLLPRSADQKSVLRRHPARRSLEMQLPASFSAADRWPQCHEEILRIHNQGHCGSCWAFGGVASIDARMCIASNGTWDAPQDILSRLDVLSCAPDAYWQGHDGCQGGFPHWPMEYMARVGVVSTSCLPYYIAGEGIEHFDHKEAAPPCETHCQGGYSAPMVKDRYFSAGVGNYDWLTSVHGDAEKMHAMKLAIYEEGPVAFAFYANQPFMGYSGGVFSVCTGHDQANHAVYSYGWGVEIAADGSSVEFMESSNSWGPNWGVNGHFRIHPRCVTDVTIPGTIEIDVVGHSVGSVDLTVPRDPDNEVWPWTPPPECPYVDGCVTDLEMDNNYSSNEECESKALIGKKLHVVEFDLELGYDFLSVNGMTFSGKAGHGLQLDDLEGIEVVTPVTFKSDSSVAATGFKLCAM